MQTDVNRHPGCELLVPLKGEVSVEYVDGATHELCRVTPSELAHYDSERPHRVANKSRTEPAEIFVIRFFGEDRRGARAKKPMQTSSRRRTRKTKIVE